MKQCSLGKLRGLQQCSTRRGALAVLAIDHRDNLRRLLHPNAPGATTCDELVTFKRVVVRTLGDSASAILLDPEFGAGQCIQSRSIPGSVGLIVAVEATGFTGEPAARLSQLLPDWSIAQTKQIGASAAKLLVYYHPDSTTAPQIESFVRQIAEECAAQELPLFLETLTYSLDPARKKLATAERRRVVIETACRLTPLGADVLKIEFPLDIHAEPDEREWRNACMELSRASTVPWILLSGSAEFESYLRQVTVACQAGASGVAVGRAVWQEATALSGEERETFLRGTALERMRRLGELCDALARPWASDGQDL